MAELYDTPWFNTNLPLSEPGASALPTRQLPAEVPATGTGDWFTSGVMAGFHGALSEGARALQAGAQMMGSPGAAQSLAEFAQEHHAREQSYARPDLEANPWSPAGIGYQIARMVPMGAAAIGGTAIGAATAPEAAAGAGAAAIAAAARTAFTRRLAGAAGAMYLPAAGANVQRQITETGELTTPGKALGLGVPEAIVQGILPGRLEKFFGEGILRGIAHSAAAQGVAGGVTEGLTQLLGDPNRGFADRAAAIGQSTLSGAALGGIVGGAFGGLHALVGKPAQSIKTEDLSKSVDQALEPPAQGQLPLTGGGVRQGQPQGELPLQAPRQPPERQLGLFGMPGTQTDLFRPEEPAPRVAEAAPAAEPPAAPAPPAAEPPPYVIDFTKGRVKEVTAEYEKATPEQQEEMVQPLIDQIIERGGKPTKPQEKWIKALGLDILDKDTGYLKDELIPERPLEEPPELTAEPAASVDPGERIEFASAGARRAPEGTVTQGVTRRAPVPATAAELAAIERNKQLTQELINAPRAVSTDPNAGRVGYASAGAERQQPSIPEVPPAELAPATDYTGPLHSQIHPKDEAAQAAYQLGHQDARADIYREFPGDPKFGYAYERGRNDGRAAMRAARDVPIKTVDDRADVRDVVRKDINTIDDPVIQGRLKEKVDKIDAMLPGAAERPNSDFATSLNTLLSRLRTETQEAAQPSPDQIAPPPLRSSPRAEAVPAPMVDLGAAVEGAQSELSKFKNMLGRGQADALAGVEQHSKWLAEVNRAGPDELQAALAKDPEALAAAETPDVADLGGLRQLSTPQKKQLAAYLNAQGEVLKALRGPESRARVVASRDGLPVKQLDADLADMHVRGVKLTDALDHITEHSADPEEAELAAWIKQGVPEDVTTSFRDGVTDKEGEYFPKQRLSTLYNAADATVTTLHEAIHAALSRVLDGNSAPARAIRGIYNQLKDKGDHAGIANEHEMVAEVANPVYRAWLKSQIVHGTSMWDRFIDAARGIIGLPPRLFNAFDRIMSHGDDLMQEQKLYPNNEWVGPDSYARVANKGTGTAAAAADYADRSLSEKLSNGMLNVREFIRNIVNGWSPGQWLARNPVFNKLSPNIQEYVNSLGMEDPRKKQLGRAAIVADRQARALPVEGQELLNQVIAASTSYGFHPDRSLADYSEIHDDPTRVQQFNVVKDLWNQLGKIPGGQEAYNTWRSTLSALGHMTAVHNLQVTERATGLAAVDSFRKFDGRDDLTNQPKLSDVYWQKELNDKIAVNKEFNNQLSAQKATVDTQLAAIKFKKDYPKELVKQSADLGSAIDKLDAAVKLAEAEQKRMFKEPYFHLGRKGDYFYTGKLVTKPGEIDEETGKPDKQIVDKDALSEFADHLEKNGINDVAIMEGNQHGTFYTRVETPAQLGALHKVMQEAQKAGLLADSPLASGKILDSHIFNRVATQATQDVIERLRANRPIAPEGTDQAVMDKAHYAQIQDLQRTLLNMTPETSMNRLMAHRQNVQGFSKDMLRSQGYAADVSAFGLARQSLMHETSAFEAGMLKDVENANRNPDVDLNTRLGLASTVAELMSGQRLRQTYVPKDWKDAARQFTNFLHIGMSSAYFPMQMSQLAITGAPELAKLQGSGLSGYGPAFMAMQRAVTPTMKALAATVRSPDGLTAGITREGLEKSTLTPAQINTIMGMELRGSLGSYTASVSEHPALTGTMLKAANTLGTYADLAPRVIMGLAADELYTAKGHPTLSREQFIDRAIGDSQGYYSAALGARQMGRGGLLGSYTPMTMQFQTWNINLTNKIYREVHDAFKGEDAQTKKDARTWLLGHAAATTMLAGTLGLPAVSVAASVYDKLMDLVTNRDDHDITASYRTFLANTFGKDMGEIIARGLPRAAGVDFANWGEGEIIPGTASLKIFTEKRKWEDVEKDWFKSMGGPALDTMFQVGLAARDITNGDYLEGLGRLAPGLVAGPMKAYRLGQDGFVDQHGQKLPMSSPGALDIALTAMGLKPQKQAEYQEVAREESGLRAMREASSANISEHLRQAWTQHDQGGFNAWMAEAQRWQVQHPGMVPPQATFGRALENHLNQLAQARATGLPIGVLPRDVGGRGLLQYGNIPMQ
jgi:hypothetical protein